MNNNVAIFLNYCVWRENQQRAVDRARALAAGFIARTHFFAGACAYATWLYRIHGQAVFLEYLSSVSFDLCSLCFFNG